MLQCCVCLCLSYVVVSTECIVAKRCVLEQKLLLTAYIQEVVYEKSIGTKMNDLVASYGHVNHCITFDV